MSDPKTPDRSMYLKPDPMSREEVLRLLVGFQHKADAAAGKEAHYDAERKGWREAKEHEIARASDLIRCLDKDLKVWALLDGAFTSFPHPDADPGLFPSPEAGAPGTVIDLKAGDVEIRDGALTPPGGRVRSPKADGPARDRGVGKRPELPPGTEPKSKPKGPKKRKR